MAKQKTGGKARTRNHGAKGRLPKTVRQHGAKRDPDPEPLSATEANESVREQSERDAVTEPEPAIVAPGPSHRTATSRLADQEAEELEREKRRQSGEADPGVDPRAHLKPRK